MTSMVSVIDYYDTTFGDLTKQKDLLKDLSDEEKFNYIKQYINIFKENNVNFANLDVDDITTRALTYDEDKLAQLIMDLRAYLHFLSYKQSTDRLFVAMGDIVESKGKLSIKSAFNKHIDNKEILNDAISSSIVNATKLLYTYKFILIQQLFNKMYTDDSQLRNDKKFTDLIEQIRNDQIDNFTNYDIIRFIRNGIAHFSFKDNVASVECIDLQGLLKNMIIQISSEKNDKNLVIDFKSFMSLMNFTTKCLNKTELETVGLPDVYFNKETPQLVKMMAVRDLYRKFTNSNKLENYEVIFINRFLEQQPEFAFTGDGFAQCKIVLKNPEVITITEIDDAIEVLKRLNRGRNNPQKDYSEILKIFPILTLSSTFNVLSNLIDLGLVKDFVKDNMDNPILAKIPCFKMDKNPKSKSVRNKFRLLRNCLAHSYLYNYTHKFHAFDIDENNVKIDLGEIEFNDLICFCELMENYICSHYSEKLNEFKNTTKNNKNVME